MIDWHCHILPHVDDGSTDLEQSVAMASVLASAGYTAVYCTPHFIRGSYEADNASVRSGVVELQERLDREHIPVKLIPGREYCLDEFLMEQLQDPLTLGDSRSVLIELLPHTTESMVRQILYSVVRAGFTPVIAHPERSALLAMPDQAKVPRGIFGMITGFFGGGNQEMDNYSPGDTSGNDLLDYLREIGCCFQGNIGSFSGFYGRGVKAVAESMKNIGLYDRYGTDLHAPEQMMKIRNPLLK